jgi:hypothetical protein
LNCSNEKPDWACGPVGFRKVLIFENRPTPCVYPHSRVPTHNVTTRSGPVGSCEMYGWLSLKTR